MIGRFVTLLLSIVVGAFLVALFVINRHDVKMVLDPFNSGDPAFAIERPFYWFMFAMLFVGVLVGGTASWLTQGKWRRTARQRTQEAMRWKAEAERLTRERDANVIERKQLLAAE